MYQLIALLQIYNEVRESYKPLKFSWHMIFFLFYSFIFFFATLQYVKQQMIPQYLIREFH